MGAVVYKPVTSRTARPAEKAVAKKKAPAKKTVAAEKAAVKK